VRSPNFVVLTDAGEGQGRSVASQFESIRAVFRRLFNIQGETKDPVVTIFAAKNEDGLRRLIPGYWASKSSVHPVGIFVPGSEHNYIALRLDVSMKQDADEPFEPVYHEYIHFALRRMRSELPLWMVEGLAEFYSRVRVVGKKVSVGTPSALNLRVLRENQALSVSTLFAVDASSPYYSEQNKTSIFYAESWALTHYLIVRDWREGTHHVNDFVDLLGHGVNSDEAARRTIGDPNQLQNELTSYIGRYAFTVVTLDLPLKADPKEFQAETVPDAESLAARGDFMAHDRNYPEAQEMLEEALKLDPKLVSAYESMGYVFIHEMKMADAWKWYSQALALNPQSVSANYYCGVILLSRKDADSAAKAESYLRAAIKIEPDLAAAYTSLATLLASHHKNLEEARMMALTAISLRPDNIFYRITAARVLLAMGQDDNAVRVAQIAVSMAKTADDRGYALAMLSRIQKKQDTW
jgi:tetratricopeptide (TPR) repeat protein